jgi:predicted Zn finger-like uncharacterized protein
MMARITVCPQCQTRFRVTEEQLQARKGDVRCGRCSHVFNARETLQEETPAAEFVGEVEAQQTHPHPNLPLEGEGTITETQEVVVESTAPEEAEPVPQDYALPEIELAAEPAENAPPDAPPEPVPEPEPEIRVIRIQPPAEKEQAKVSPERPKYGPPPKPKRVWPWALASLLLVLGMAGQGVYFFRDAIAANYPPVRPLLERACAHLQCSIKLLQNPDLLSIESSELHADPARANIVVLTSTLRNRAPHVQGYPTLELTLTNTKDEMVARRLFLPREYVRQIPSIAQGIPAKGDVAIKLLMDLGDLKAEGYRLYLFYPS